MAVWIASSASSSLGGSAATAELLGTLPQFSVVQHVVEGDDLARRGHAGVGHRRGVGTDLGDQRTTLVIDVAGLIEEVDAGGDPAVGAHVGGDPQPTGRGRLVAIAGHGVGKGVLGATRCFHLSSAGSSSAVTLSGVVVVAIASLMPLSRASSSNRSTPGRKGIAPVLNSSV